MGLDQGRRLRIGLDLLAQPADLVVDGAVERLGVAPDREVEQLVAAQHQPGMVEEHAEQAGTPRC